MKNYTLKLYKTDKKVETVRTKKKRRFLTNLRTINWQNKGIERTYIKVSYGKKLCVFGCLCEFYNDGYYDNKEELLQTFRYFEEEN